MYDSWDMKCNQTEYFVTLDHFFSPFTPLTNQKIKILKEWKKTSGDIIILHNCTKNHDHMVYCSWDMAHDRCNYYSPKTQNFKKMKKTARNIILHMWTINDDQMMYGSWDLVHNEWIDEWTDRWADSTLNFQ